MFSRLSLRYRIALVIFLLESCMLAVVLGVTLTESRDSVIKLDAANQTASLDLLANLSVAALLTGEYADYQLYLQDIEKQPTIDRIVLADAHNHVVAGSDVVDVGKEYADTIAAHATGWRTREIDTRAGRLGVLAVRFSDAAIIDASSRTRNLAITIAVTGMATVAFVGLAVGFALTRRLGYVTRAARQITDGRLDVRSNVTGRDEIADLGAAFNAMLDHIARKETALQNTNRALRAVSACSAAMIHAGTEEQLLNEVCRVIVEKAGYRMAWVGWARQDSQHSVVPIARYGFDDGYVDAAHIRWDDSAHGQGPTGKAIRNGTPEAVREIRTDTKYGPWREAAMARGYASSLALPLTLDGATIGALNIYADAPYSFDADEQELLAGLAHDLSFGINALRVRNERDQALAGLARHTAQFEAMFNAIPDAVMFADKDRRIVLNNPAVHAMFGYSDDELIGRTTEMLYADPRDFIDQGRKRFRTGPGSSTAPYEVRYKRKDGTVFWTESLGAQVKDAQGNHVGFIGIFRDISERRETEETIRRLNAELEQRVHERTEQLEIANKDLEAFSYSVSHDLRAPLRSIDGFMHVLDEDYASQLDATARHYVQRVRAAAQRMGLLIDDLLNLSRVSRIGMRRETVDLSRLAAELVDELRMTEPERAVSVDIAPNLAGTGDPMLLRMMLQNLLGNAWKYTRRTEHARIEFGETVQDGQRVLFVRDNGAGFDMQYAEKLFAPFSRLHRTEEFEGTGIGLATVGRILSRHGGRIRATAAVGQGATFFFTLGDDPRPSNRTGT